jgi:hypothetical protein
MVLRTDNNSKSKPARRRYLFSEPQNYSTLCPFGFQAIAKGRGVSRTDFRVEIRVNL